MHANSGMNSRIKTGPLNGITDIKGLLAGHFTDMESVSGTTVVLCPDGAVAGVDVRGAAPGTRETDLLNPVNLVDTVQGICLCGGSVYGLAAADGVVRYLAEKGHGFALDATHVAPIVPAAVIYDLGRGPSFVPPVDAGWGYKACLNASQGAIQQGSVGAGTGAGSFSIKGGVGTASQITEDGIMVAALVVVNSHGSPVDPQTGLLWEARPGLEADLGSYAAKKFKLPPPARPQAATNTTIGVVATEARLTKSQATKIAQMAHDGLARAIRPCHTMFDGDTFFCLATGAKPLPADGGPFHLTTGAAAVTALGQAAADCVCRAIMRGLLAAESLAGLKTLSRLAGDHQ